jgi:RNA polymerase primary sigma factor
MAPPKRAVGDDPIIAGIRRIPALRRDDNDALARTIASGGPDAARARDRMVEGNMRLVLRVALKYADGTMTLHDRLQEGAMGLMRAIRKFDPNRGISFATYALYWIRAAIDRAHSINEHEITVPGSVSAAMRCLRRIESRSQDPLTDAEFRDALNFGDATVKAVRMLPTSVVPFDAPLSFDDPEGVTVGDTVPHPSDASPEDGALLDDLRRILDRCPEITDREMTMLRMFAAGDSYQAMGDAYGLTRERARQIIIAVMAMMQSKSGVR